MGAVFRNIGKGKGKPKGFGDIFQGSVAGGTAFRIRDVGDDPLYGSGPGKVSEQGSETDHLEAAPAVIGRNLVVPRFGDGDVGGRV